MQDRSTSLDSLVRSTSSETNISISFRVEALRIIGRTGHRLLRSMVHLHLMRCTSTKPDEGDEKASNDCCSFDVMAWKMHTPRRTCMCNRNNKEPAWFPTYNYTHCLVVGLLCSFPLPRFTGRK